MNMLQEIMERFEQIDSMNIDQIKQLWVELYELEKVFPGLKQSQEFRFFLSKLADYEEKPYYTILQQPDMNVQTLSYIEMTELSMLTLDDEQVKRVLDTVVFKVRTFLKEYHKIDILKHHLTGFCIEATNHIFMNWGRLFRVLPYQAQCIFDKNVNHYFAVFDLDTIRGSKRYIIDPTYR